MVWALWGFGLSHLDWLEAPRALETQYFSCFRLLVYTKAQYFSAEEVVATTKPARDKDLLAFRGVGKGANTLLSALRFEVICRLVEHVNIQYCGRFTALACMKTECVLRLGVDRGHQACRK